VNCQFYQVPKIAVLDVHWLLQQLIWRGQTTKTLNPSNDQLKDMERLNKAMAKLLKHFPPQH
jgi:hypothetical protein